MAKEDISAFLGESTIYQGKLNFSGTVRIDGQFTGEIHSDGTLVLGKEAKVQGKVNVNQLVLTGFLSGEAIVKEKTTMHKTAMFLGNLMTKAMVMEEGAVLQGTITMREDIEKPADMGEGYSAPVEEAFSTTPQ